jgi:hypothetical protein
VQQLSSIEANWKEPAIDLAGIRIGSERCFEEPAQGPRW